MSRTYRSNDRNSRHIRVRGIRRDPADMKRLSRALIELSKLQQAEAERLASVEAADETTDSKQSQDGANQQGIDKRDSA